MGAFEELLDSWRSNPDSDSTLALCSYLSAAPKEDVVREVGARAEQWHAQDGEVMLAVGRMYLDANLLSEAQSALVNAGKTNPSDARPFRQLGEVLLRRGDAARAEKVLSRALQLGLSDGETRLWHDRAVVYVALQKRVGAQAVAAEVARTLPKRNHEAVAARAPAPAPLPVAAGWGEEAPTRRQAAPQHAPPAARPQILQAPQRPKSVPPPLPPMPVQSPPLPPPPAMPRADISALSDDDDQTAVQGLPSYATDVPQARAGAQMAVTGGTVPMAFPAQAPPAPVRPPPPQAPLPQFGSAQAPLPQFGSPAHSPAPGPVFSPPVAPPPAYVPPQAPAPVYAPQPAPIPRASLEEGGDVHRPMRLGDAPNPTPEAVLDSLARVGVYEPAGGAAPAWETPTLQKARGSWVLIVGTIVVLGAGGGAYYYAKKVKDDRAEYAKRLSDEVDVMIHSGDMGELHASDEKLSKIFELDSRSSRAAKLWLQNRVLTALMIPDEPRGIDSAVHRARQVEVPESEVAFGKIASFLVEGDLAGAASVLPRYDREAGKDAFYQLTAGAVLERAGDLRAVERYEAAQKADGKLVLADILLARLALFELGTKKARPVIEALKKKTGETPNTRALEALAWAVDGERPKELPKSAVLSEEDKRNLILPLLPVPAIVEAIQAMGTAGGGGAKVSSSIDSAILLSDTPAMATQLGFLAIKAGDEKLARKAALRALQFSALYPQARVLASRVALLGGRIDEAKKAIEELDPRTPEVVVVRGVVAYESLDTGELGSAVEALGEAAKHPDYAGLAAGRGVVLGREMPPPDQLETMSQPYIPWGEIVAVDAAMATGNLELADKLVKAWGDGAARPVFALRVAQLRRYQNNLDEADKYSAKALDGTTTARVITERVYCLAAKDQAAQARDLIAKYPSLLGPMADWLRMFVDAKTSKAGDARSKAAQLDFPSDEAPLLLRLAAARGLASLKDRRAKNYVSTLQRKLKKHPELLLAAADLK